MITVASLVLPKKSFAALAIACICFGTASAQIAFQDVSIAAGFGPSSAAESWGTTWGDVDGDHYPDIFANNHRTPAKLFRNNRNGTFTDVSQQVDVSHSWGWTGSHVHLDKHGDTWGDVDNDGDLDLLIGVSSAPDHLLINEQGKLSDRSAQYGIDKLHHVYTRANLFLDYNGDGRLDVASISLTRPAFAPQLSNGTFSNFPGLEVPTACSTEAEWAHLADVDAAPGIELLCAPQVDTYPKVNTFRNGIVSNASSSYSQFSTVNDAISLDYNRDLRSDVFIVRRSERSSDAYQGAPNRFEAQLITAPNNGKSVTFKSSGILTLIASLRAGSDPQGDPSNIDIGSIKWSPTSLTVQLDPKDPRNSGIATGSPGINIGYLTASGEWKITQKTGDYDYSYVQVSSTAPINNVTFSGASASDKGLKPVLLSNTVNGLIDVSAAAGFTVPLGCESAVAGDFDNDMDEDIYLACAEGSHNTPNRLFMNDGKGKFAEVANAGGAAGLIGSAVVDKAGTSDSVVTADYDLDGFLDLFEVNGLNMRPVYTGGPHRLFHNRRNANHWIEFDLVGTRSNRDGIGSKAYVTSGAITQYREQNGGYHRWSQNSMRLHFGLASNTLADVTVDWPDGTSTVYSGLQANHVFQLKQDGTQAVIK